MKTQQIVYSQFFIGIIFSLLSSTAAFSQVSETAIKDRADAIAIIEELRKIHTPEGIEVLEQVELGGLPQWVSIRGKNRNNPVLLFIHGGPGDPMIGLSWAFQTLWEDYFTVVQWDQRGQGKNAVLTDRDIIKSSFTIEQLASDAAELVEHLCTRLDKEKVAVMGFSLGGTIGTHLAKQRPERLHAYVGIGQPWQNLALTQKVIYERTLEVAKELENHKAIRDLEGISNSIENSDGMDPNHFWKISHWVTEFNGGWYGKRNWDLWAELTLLSPEYEMEEVIAAQDAAGWLVPNFLLNNHLNIDLKGLGPKFEIPVFIFHGRHDLSIPIESITDYFNWIQAPYKNLVIFKCSAHAPFFEEPGRFFAALLEHVLPLTEGAANYEVHH